MFDDRNSQSIRTAARTACVIAMLAIVVGCAAPERMAAVPDGRAADAIVPGIERARVYVLADTQTT